MTDAILALIPDYGLIVVFCVVALACLAVPVPASVLTLASGSFAAVGDVSLNMVLITVLLAFIIADQAAFLIAWRVGREPMHRLSRAARIGPVIQRSEALLQRHGAAAVFLSHTIFSPTCPYVTYLCGAGGLPWARFTLVAVPGAAVWTCAYVGSGYIFASQLEQAATLISNIIGSAVALGVAVGTLIVLRNRWGRPRAQAI